MGEDGRMAEIGFENNALLVLFYDMTKYGIKNRNSPLFRAIVVILEHYYLSLSDDEIKAIAKKAGILASYPLGRMYLGKK